MHNSKKAVILFCLLFCFKSVSGQTSTYTAHKLTKLFKSSIGNGEWIICNHDSSYFTSDTIRLFDNINYFYQKGGCCDFVKWTFAKKNAFVQSKFQVCKEPSTGDIIDPEHDTYTIKTFSDNRVVYLFVSKWKSVEVFQLVGVDDIKLLDNRSAKVVTLKRTMTRKSIVGHTY